ncbi:unnamed protein product [Leptidea sinapis]|uniref:Uncharacterized protein n=1 Tax=Leptidea sinapis TaxID=189913 RepID=A0A5E4QMB6_9NEOP|nr:unnamed protein product [Leptidea sinapis]
MQPDYQLVRNKVNSVENINDDAVESERKQGEDMKIDDKETLAEIDVASFIQNPDYDTIDNNEPYNDVYKRSQLSRRDDVDSLFEVNENENDNNEEYLELDNNSDDTNILENLNNLKYIRNSKSSHDSKISSNAEKKHNNNEHILVTPENKCVFKRMKFPFFSRDKTSTKKAKVNKKRKLFQFNSKNYKEKMTQPTSSSGITASGFGSSERPAKVGYRLRKRSYVERICPLCRRRFKANKSEGRGKLLSNFDKTVQNSREFFRQVKPDSDKIKNDEEGENRIRQTFDINQPIRDRYKKSNSVRNARKE